LEIAQGFGPIVEAQPSDSLVSLKRGGTSSRKGTRHFNLFYSNHVALHRTLDLDECLTLFGEFMEVASITMSDDVLHVDASRLFAWEADHRLISVVGPDDASRLVVAGLRPYLMPERTSFTSFCGNDKVAFCPLADKWRGRIIHKPLPLTDLVFLVPPGTQLSRSQAILRLFELSSGKIPVSDRLNFLSNSLRGVRFHNLEIGELLELPQQFSDLLGLNVQARDISHLFEAAL